MKYNLDTLMIRICALLFVIACLFAVDCYRQYRNMVSVKNMSELSTYTAATR